MSRLFFHVYIVYAMVFPKPNEIQKISTGTLGRSFYDQRQKKFYKNTALCFLVKLEYFFSICLFSFRFSVKETWINCRNFEYILYDNKENEIYKVVPVHFGLSFQNSMSYTPRRQIKQGVFKLKITKLEHILYLW